MFQASATGEKSYYELKVAIIDRNTSNKERAPFYSHADSMKNRLLHA